MTDLIATTGDITSDNPAHRDGWTGLPLADDYKGISDAIESGSWIDGSVAGLGAALNVASIAIDPFSTLLSMGIEWAIEQIQPLRDALDWLAGDPEIIETHAMTWDNMATELFSIGEDLKARLEGDLESWQGAAADAYRAKLAINIDVAGIFGGTAAGMGSATRGAGTLVTMVREFVRGFIADCVAKVVVWLAEVAFTVGVATPLVAAQMAVAVVKWVGRIFGWLMGLVTSIQSLRALLDV
ncbi:WXG100 family type VII secretion target [Phytomonospora endophytica]|uniref:PPE family domain-containing protein n=1 Tax=Phytomonospora endophytica TaxID=714109 RepID=A0A841FRX2_9ACTN|nr:hypothetical protein [Phytomonospora endophytica]MBB6036057.1 hypothetical protein [Phytomonospora endophytica]GIG66962.1 hypothetical protein Pen01_32570 [Phytomonospora endophytica]